MRFELIKPAASLNKAYRKTSLKRDQIDLFKANLKRLFDRINDQESEEHLKNIVSDFLKDTWYKNLYEINTKGRSDLVIHNGKSSSDTVGVIFEVKRPVNKSEMITAEKPNEKALHELLNYYLDERYIRNNKEIKHLIITNIHEWYIFDGSDFERFFFENQKLIKQFKEWQDGQFGVKLNDWFYKEIAKPFIEKELISIKCNYFNLKSFETIIRNEDKSDDVKLINLYKTLSPEHLLKKPFANDSNSLDKAFYTELLHIIGLTETKEGSKKLIGRKKDGQRDSGSLIENAIIQIDSRDMISRIVKPSRFGETHQERLFNVSLDLVITWIDRILFLKLLEAQLIKYHKGDPSYSFLSIDKMKGYDALDSLFFRVLAKKTRERDPAVIKLFEKVPYLNSSLFEPTELERETIFISNLQDDCMIPFHPGTVLKNSTGKRLTGTVNGLDYLFAFLDAYDFSGEGAEGIQEENKTLINASVLGLIFEKINGYKDGSIFTPGFITMYMCRETIRRAVVQKINDLKGWNCQNLKDVYDKIEDRQEANDIINSLKLCDPGVGSGHFLVSSLNEIIAIKSELKILLDKEGKRLKEYRVEVANDELIITDEDGELYEYNPKNSESQRVQEALFHEKQTIIENCLFGVDINPNSVKICRLRLWIELLKNSYYTAESNFTELETLPNIDINIKCGNSLISRYALDADIKQALKKSKWSIDSYRMAVMMYRNATSKEQKREMERLIESIKTDFETEVVANDKRLLQLKKLNGDLFNLTNQTALFERTKKELADWNKNINELTVKIKKLETELGEIKNNKIYENAFEWRFEFPEVLNDEGDFVGFDVVIGNPPYIYRNVDIDPYIEYFKTHFYNTSGNFDLYKYFIERSIQLLKKGYYNSFITNSSFLLQTSFEKTRKVLLENVALMVLAPLGPNVFDEATVDSAIYIIKKLIIPNNEIDIIVAKHPSEIQKINAYKISQQRFSNNDGFIFDYLLQDIGHKIIKRLFKEFPALEKGYEFGVGINTGYIKSELTSKTKLDSRYHSMVSGSGIARYGIPVTDVYIMYDKEFVKSKGNLGRTLPDERFFTNPKILVVRTRNLSLKRRIIATIDYDKFYNLNRLSNIISREGYSLEGLLGLLNSTLYNWIYSVRFLDYEIKPVYLRNSPLCDTNDPKLISLVTNILADKKSNSTSYITTLEKEIDQLVYELYGLTEEEIKIVEGTK